MSAIVTTRTARKRHTCSRCQKDIEPGERYEASALPPGGEMGLTGWWRVTSHAGSYLYGALRPAKADYDRLGIGCAESAAYREARHRVLVAAGPVRDGAR